MSTAVLTRTLRQIETNKPQRYGVIMPHKEPPQDDRYDEEFPEKVRRGIRDAATIMPQSTVQEIADTAAYKAARRVLLPFGVDVDNAESMMAFTQDMIELRRQRLARERWGWMLKSALLTALLSAAGWFISGVVKQISSTPHSPSP